MPTGVDYIRGEVSVEGLLDFNQLPRVYKNKFRAADTTPSVLNVETFEGSGSVVSITSFDDGQEGQVVRILGDGTTTVVHNASLLRTNTGSNKLLTTGTVFRFTLFGGVWIEDAAVGGGGSSVGDHTHPATEITPGTFAGGAGGLFVFPGLLTVTTGPLVLGADPGGGSDILRLTSGAGTGVLFPNDNWIRSKNSAGAVSRILGVANATSALWIGGIDAAVTSISFRVGGNERVTINSAGQVTSNLITGTAPFIVASTTLVTNLNADLLDGQHGSFYQNATNINAGTLADARLSANVPLKDTAGTITGLWTFNRGAAAPFAVAAGALVVANLDADKLDGFHEAAFAKLADNETITGNWDWTSLNWIRFGHANQTDGNDGKIGAALFASGLNIVGTQTVALEGRVIRTWGTLLSDQAYSLGTAAKPWGTGFFQSGIDFLSTETQRWAMHLSGIGGLQIRPRAGALDPSVFITDNGDIVRTSINTTTGLLTVHTGGLQVTVGNLALGGAPIAQQGIRVAGAVLSGATDQRGASIEPTISSGATGIAIGVLSKIVTPAVAFTVTDAIGFYAQNHTKGAGSTITTAYGLYVESQTVGATNYAIYTNGGLVRFGDDLLFVGASAQIIAANGGAGAIPGRIRFNQGSPVAIEAVSADNTNYTAFRAAQVRIANDTGDMTPGIVFDTDNANNIGADQANRPANVYVAGAVHARNLGTTGLALRIGNDVDIFEIDTDSTINLRGGPAGTPAKGFLTFGDGSGLRVGYDSVVGEAVYDAIGTTPHHFFEDVIIGSLGRFDSTSVPDLDDVLRYNGTKWIPVALQFRFTDGDVVAQAFTDGTAAALVDDGRVVDDTPAPVAPSVAPTLRAGYKSIVVDLAPLGALPADKKWVVQWSDDAGVSWSDAAGNEIVTTGDKVMHTKLPIDGTQFRYRVRQRGATTSAAGPSTSDLAPLTEPDIFPATIIVASQIAVVDLASISANIGVITAGLIRNAADTHGILISGAMTDTSPSGWRRWINFPDETDYFIANYKLLADAQPRFGTHHDGSIVVSDSTNVLFTITSAGTQAFWQDPGATQGISVAGAIPGTWVRYIGLDDANTYFIKHPKFEVQHDGRVRVLEGANTLFEINAAGTSAYWQNTTATAGANVMGAVPGGWTTYTNLNGSGSFLRHARLQVDFDGTVLMYQTSAQPLFKLNATDFLIQNDAVSPTQGVLVDGTLPGTWTRYLNLNGSGTFLKHDRLDLLYDGTAIFKGSVEIVDPLSGYTLEASTLLAMKDSDVAHGMTSLVPTDAFAAFGGVNTLAGGLSISGFEDGDLTIPLLLQGHMGGSTVTRPVFAVQGWKKSGTARVAVSGSDPLWEVRAGTSPRFQQRADGLAILFDDSGVEAVRLTTVNNNVPGSPALSFNGDTDTGIYRNAADTVNVATGGSERARFNASGLEVQGSIQSRIGSSTVLEHHPHAWSFASASTTSTSFTALHTYTIPDDAFDTDGDAIYIIAAGEAVSQQGQFELQVDGVTEFTSVNLSVGHIYWIEIVVQRSGVTAMQGYAKWSSGGASFANDSLTFFSGVVFAWTSQAHTVTLRGKTNAGGGTFFLRLSHGILVSV